MRDICQHTGDPARLVQLHARFALMERTAAANRSLLLRLQTARQKRDRNEADAGQASWLEHIALRQMQEASAPPRPSRRRQNRRKPRPPRPRPRRRHPNPKSRRLPADVRACRMRWMPNLSPRPTAMPALIPAAPA